MGLPDILNVHEITVQMMYVVCLVGFSPGVLEFCLTRCICKCLLYFGQSKCYNDRNASDVICFTISRTFPFGLLLVTYCGIMCVSEK